MEQHLSRVGRSLCRGGLVLGSLVILVIGSLAFGQEPPPTTRNKPLEITVWGDAAIADARRRVVSSMSEVGYQVAKRKKDGIVVFKPPANYLGRAYLTPDGELRFGQKVFGGFGSNSDPSGSQAMLPPQEGGRPTGTERPNGKVPPPGPVYTGESQTGPGTEPLTGTSGVGMSIMPSSRKSKSYQAQVLRQVNPALRAYRQVIRDTAMQQVLQALPGRLDALWAQGTPLDGGPTLTSYAQKREAVLAYWATRPATPEGQAVCLVVEEWLVEVVQRSTHPLQPGEIASVVDQRTDGRHPLGQPTPSEPPAPAELPSPAEPPPPVEPSPPAEPLPVP